MILFFIFANHFSNLKEATDDFHDIDVFQIVEQFLKPPPPPAAGELPVIYIPMNKIPELLEVRDYH